MTLPGCDAVRHKAGAALTLSNGIQLEVLSAKQASGQGSRFRILMDDSEDDDDDDEEDDGADEGKNGSRSIQQQSFRVQHVLKPEASGWTGGGVWESARILAHLLSAEPDRVEGKRVIELGCGCGFVGLAAGGLGAREVVLTDQVLFMAQHNLAANFPRARWPNEHGRFQVRLLKWGDRDQLAALGAPFDVVLGSDIMYHTADLLALADTIAAVSGPGTQILLATPDWISHPGEIKDSDVARRKEFQRRLSSHGFIFRVISAEPSGAKAKAKVEGSHTGIAVDVIEMRRD